MQLRRDFVSGLESEPICPGETSSRRAAEPLSMRDFLLEGASAFAHWDGGLLGKTHPALATAVALATTPPMEGIFKEAAHTESAL